MGRQIEITKENWKEQFRLIGVRPALLEDSGIPFEYYPSLYKKLHILNFIKFIEIEKIWQLRLLTGELKYYTLYLEQDIDDKYNQAHYAVWSGNLDAFKLVKEKKPKLIEKIVDQELGFDHFAVLSQNIAMVALHKSSIRRAKDFGLYNIGHLAALLGWLDGIKWIHEFDSTLLDEPAGCNVFGGRDLYIHHFMAFFSHVELLRWMRANKPHMLDGPEFNDRANVPELALVCNDGALFNEMLHAAGMYYCSEFVLNGFSKTTLDTLNKVLDTNFNLQCVHAIEHIEKKSFFCQDTYDEVLSKLKRNRDNIIELKKTWPNILLFFMISPVITNPNINILWLPAEVVKSIGQLMLPKELPRSTRLSYFNHFLFQTEQSLQIRPPSKSFHVITPKNRVPKEQEILAQLANDTNSDPKIK